MAESELLKRAREFMQKAGFDKSAFEIGIDGDLAAFAEQIVRECADVAREEDYPTGRKIMAKYSLD